MATEAPQPTLAPMMAKRWLTVQSGPSASAVTAEMATSVTVVQSAPSETGTHALPVDGERAVAVGVGRDFLVGAAVDDVDDAVAFLRGAGVGGGDVVV